MFKGSRYIGVVMAVPMTLFVASFGESFSFFPFDLQSHPSCLAMSIMVQVESARPSQSFFAPIAVKFVLAYYSLTATMTIISTGLLAFRILSARKRLRKALGEILARLWALIDVY